MATKPRKVTQPTEVETLDSILQDVPASDFRGYQSPERVQNLSAQYQSYDSLVISPRGALLAGTRGYDQGSGIFAGLDGDEYKFSIGDKVKYDGTVFRVNGLSVSREDVLGDGADGNVTISGTVNLMSDMFYNYLTVDLGAVLNMNGYKVFVKETLTNNGTIHRNGTDGNDADDATFNDAKTGASAPSGLADGSLKGTVAGAAGGNGGDSGQLRTNGAAGSNTTESVGVDASDGGRGYDVGGPAFVGTNAAGGTVTPILNTPRAGNIAYLLLDSISGEPAQSSASSGAGGGGDRSGGVAAAGSGGSSGTPGAIGFIAAKKIVNNGTISVNGGAGGAGGNAFSTAGNSAGGAGGAAGSPGGALFLLYGELENNGSITASGGTAGPGGLGSQNGSLNPTFDGEDGDVGPDGIIYEFEI